MANPNPSRRWTKEEQQRGPKVAAEMRKRAVLERRAFEESFTEAASLLGLEAEELRRRLVARLCAEALNGKGWALEKALAYLYGAPKQDVSLTVEQILPPERLPDIPDDLREELRHVRLRLRALRDGQ